MQDVHRMNSIVDKILSHLPGPATAEKLCRFDHDIYTDWNAIAHYEYAQILNELIRLFDYYWPLHKPDTSDAHHIEENVINLFSINHSAHFVYVSISTMFAKQNAAKFATLVKIFEKCLRTECWLASAFVDLCFVNDDHECQTVLTLHNQNQFIQLLIATPSKIANFFAGLYSSSLFQIEQFSCILSLAVIQSVHFIAEKHKVEKTKMFETKFLGQLFGRIAVDFNLNRSSKVLTKVFHIISAAAAQHSDLKAVVQEMFLHLHRNSLEIVAWYVLSTNNPIDVLGTAVQSSVDWKFVFKTKLPLTTVATCEQFITKLIEYLAKMLPNDECYEVVRDVAKAWSSKASINSNSLEQHIYLTKLIVLGVNWFEISKQAAHTESIRSIVHNGIKNHMESLNHNIRAIGMIAGEIVLNMLNNGDEESRLEFSYDDFSTQTIQIVNDIRQFGEQSATEQVSFGQVDAMVIELYDIVNNVESTSDTIAISKPIVIQNTAIEIGSLSAASTSGASILTTPKTLDAETLDSDDDDDDNFQPYDMSNDVPLVQEKAPHYLQDLRDALLETDDPDIFEQSLISSAKLISDKLPNDLTDIGLELLKILIVLDKRFYMEKFETHRLSACVTIVCVEPKKYAEYLCKQIHAEMRKYSIAQKILMLEVLRESAKDLSKLNEIQKQKEQPICDGPKEAKKLRKLIDTSDDHRERVLNAKRIIGERIEKKTRRFAHSSMNFASNGRPNQFADVAGSFVFPLLYGFGKEQLTLYGMKSNMKHDIDNIFLLDFLHTIATITFASINCPIISKITQEVLQMASVLRFHTEPKIRLAVLQIIAAALMATPKHILQTHFSSYLYEIRAWLEEMLSFNIVKKEQIEECRDMAANVLALCIDALTSDT